MTHPRPNHFYDDDLGDPATCTGDHNHPDEPVVSAVPDPVLRSDARTLTYVVTDRPDAAKAYSGHEFKPETLKVKAQDDVIYSVIISGPRKRRDGTYSGSQEVTATYWLSRWGSQADPLPGWLRRDVEAIAAVHHFAVQGDQ